MKLEEKALRMVKLSEEERRQEKLNKGKKIVQNEEKKRKIKTSYKSILITFILLILAICIEIISVNGVISTSWASLFILILVIISLVVTKKLNNK